MTNKLTVHTTTLLTDLAGLLGTSAKLWPNGKPPKPDDLYEVYLWAETLRIADAENWKLAVFNAGPKEDDFTFRRGPGLLTSKKPYTYATLKKGSHSGELHIGLRIAGASTTLHEFDVVALDQKSLSKLSAGEQPGHGLTRLHIEAKFHTAELSLGTGRALLGLGVDCPTIEPFLVSRGYGSVAIRPLVKAYGGHYVHNMVPGGGGETFFETCVKAACVFRRKPATYTDMMPAVVPIVRIR